MSLVFQEGTAETWPDITFLPYVSLLDHVGKFLHMIDVAYIYHVSKLQHPTRSRSETYGKKKEALNQCVRVYPKVIPDLFSVT